MFNVCLQESCQNSSYICYKCGVGCSSRVDLLGHLAKEHRMGVRRKCPHCQDTYTTLMPLAVLR